MYLDGNRAIVLMDEAEGQYGTVSVNLPHAAHRLSVDEFFAKTYSENERLRKPALESGLFEDTGRREKAGLAEAEVWRIIRKQV